MAWRPKSTLAGQGFRITFALLIVVHVLISAWLVVDFNGKYTEGSPAPTEITALVAVDKEETLIEVKMEKSTPFILYMLFRDYDSSFENNESLTESNNQSNDTSSDNQTTEDEHSNKKSNGNEVEWLKIGRNSVFVFMFLMIATEILMLFQIRFMTIFRFISWFGLVLCFTVVMPATYVLDLTDDGAEEQESEDSLAGETFVESAEYGSMAHEDSTVDSELIAFGLRFDMTYSGYDLGLVEPENYTEIRENKPEENSTLANSFVKFESTLDIKYGKNLPALFLIPIAWYLFPAVSRKVGGDKFVLRPTSELDVKSMWELNEQGLPGTGKVSLEEMNELVELSELSIGAYENDVMVGFVLCLLPKTNYGSLNYAWFNERYEEFIYVDRIAVSSQHRNLGIGTELYKEVFDYAKEKQIPVAAEVSLKPSNEGSDRFHTRHGFEKLDVLHHDEKSVTMYIKHIESQLIEEVKSQ